VNAPATGPASVAVGVDAVTVTAGRFEGCDEVQLGNENDPMRVCHPASLVVA
jgi:hypothetical protein